MMVAKTVADVNEAMTYGCASYYGGRWKRENRERKRMDVVEGMETRERDGLRCGMRGLRAIGADLPKG